MTLKAVSNAYLSIVQDISQSVLTAQILDIDCTSSGDKCNECISDLKSKKNYQTQKPFTDIEINKLCKPICSCKIEDINMDMLVTLNFSSFLMADVKETFKKNVMNNMYIQAKQSGMNLFMMDSRIESINKQIDILYESMKSNIFQESVQKLSAIQVLKIKGGGVRSIDMNMTISIISTCILSTQVTSEALTKLQLEMISLTEQVTDAAIAALIKTFIQIIVIVLLIILFVYGFNLMLTLLGLIAG